MGCWKGWEQKGWPEQDAAAAAASCAAGIRRWDRGTEPLSVLLHHLQTWQRIWTKFLSPW